MNDKSILFLTYYFHPCNYVAANRPNSFTKNFVSQGYCVTVVTRHWTGRERVWQDYITSNTTTTIVVTDRNREVHYLPYHAIQYPHRLVSIFNTFWQNLNGFFHYEIQYGQFENYIETLIRAKKFDYILLSVPPLTILRSASSLAKKFQIPLILDVRDFENDILLYHEKKRSWLRRMQHAILMIYFKRWARHVRIVCTASEPLSDYIKDKSGCDTITVTNGFNEELLSLNEPQSKTWFTITVIGSLYERANLQVMVEAIRLLLTRHPDAQIRFRFFGLLVNDRVARIFQQVIPPEQLTVTHRIPQQEAFKEASSSHVLMLDGFHQTKGIYTSKIFEYLGLRRKIIQIPGDRDVVESLIKNSHAGAAPHTSEDAYQILWTWYNEWKETGSLSYEGNLDYIMQFSREAQFKKLLQRIEKETVPKK